MFSSGNVFCAKVFDLPSLIHCAVSTLLSLFPNSAASQMKLLQVRLCVSRLEEILFTCCSRVGCHRIFHILSNIPVHLWLDVLVVVSSTGESLEHKGKKPKQAQSCDLSFDTLKESDGSEYMRHHVRRLPIFTARYGDIPETMLVRQCYKELYSITVAFMLSPESGDRHPAVLFTGVPGIGKSMFLLYFMLRFSCDDRFTDKGSFCVEFEHGKYNCFEPVHDQPNLFEISLLDDALNPPVGKLVLADIKDNVNPAGRGKWTLIFSSPNPARYKETMKATPHMTCCMPTWDENELQCIATPREVDWQERFTLYGGVPRIVFDTADILTRALEAKGKAVSQHFFESGFGGIDGETSYILLHINPPRNADTMAWEYSKLPVHSFASDEIFKRVSNKHRDAQIAKVADLFDSGTAESDYGSATAGLLFEKVCLWLTPIDGMKLKATSLLRTDYSIEITLPAKESILQYGWADKADLEVDILYKPVIGNLESGDAFCMIVGEDRKPVLIVLQITVGMKHPVKTNGLKRILHAFPHTLQESLTKKMLLFITPKNGRLSSVQKWHTQQDTVAKKAPDFEQFVCRHTLAL